MVEKCEVQDWKMPEEMKQEESVQYWKCDICDNLAMIA